MDADAGADTERAPDPVALEREERHRLAVLAASGPILLLLGPLVLPTFDDRSFFTAARGEAGPLVILACIFFWPLFVGALSLRRGLARRAPGTAAYLVPAVLHLLAASGIALLLLTAAFERTRARESPGVGMGIVLTFAAVYVMARGFRRRGWERWAQLVAGMWLGYAVFAIMVAVEGRGAFDPPETGGFVLLFALSMAAPAVAWILWPKPRR